MSHGAKTAERRARQVVSSEIKDLYAKFTSHGLPEDILERAFSDYGSTGLSWSELRAKALNFKEYVSAHVSNCTIRHILRRPIGTKAPAASVSIFRLMANPLRQAQTLFGANVYTFTFWPSEGWFLTTTDPLYTTDHLHQRLIQRDPHVYQTLAKTQDDLSILWPTLHELHQQRRRKGIAGELANFVTPLADGLVFGEFQRNDLGGILDVADVAPILFEFRNGMVVKQMLFDCCSDGRERLMVKANTYIGNNQLKDVQRSLKTGLDKYIKRHGAIIECLRLRTRLAFDAEHRCGRENYKLYVAPPIRASEFQKALFDLDEITSSVDWSSEISRSVENIRKRT